MSELEHHSPQRAGSGAVVAAATGRAANSACTAAPHGAPSPLILSLILTMFFLKLKRGAERARGKAVASGRRGHQGEHEEQRW